MTEKENKGNKCGGGERKGSNVTNNRGVSILPGKMVSFAGIFRASSACKGHISFVERKKNL